MAVEKKFVQDGFTKALVNEYLAKELERAGYGGMQMNRTPMGTQITVYAEKPGMVIGKGGMGSLTAKAMREFGAVYCAITGGTGALIAKTIKKVDRVEWVELGTPEAIWSVDVEKMGPMVIAIDSNGDSLYGEVHRKAEAFLEYKYRPSGS